MHEVPRIGVFTKPLDNWRSGSGHHLNEILSHALGLGAGERFNLTFIHYRPSDNPIYRRPGVSELLIPRSPLAASARLAPLGFDVLHYAPLTIYAPLWLRGPKKMATMHGAEQLLVPQFYGPVELAHERFVVPAYARRMDYVVTVSETSRDYFVREFHVRPDRITVCYNGLGPGYKKKDPAGVTTPGRLGVKTPFIFHISRFSERKNPWTLLRAFARFGATRPDYTLVCAGGGWDNPKVRAEVGRLGLEGRVRFPGFLREEEVVDMLNAARVFVFPSLAEGFGMPNLEAMACGCPVVTTRIFAIPEVVGDAALILDDPLDAEGLAALIARAAEDEAERTRLVGAGAARIGRFSWKESAAKLLGVYEALASAKREGR